jgi:16S rRNA (cytidine1402-2'-O)-methyltransferase
MTRPRAPRDEPAGSTGTLYIVSTPIGNLEDVTMRALRVLGECSLIAAEDTRRTRKLLSRYDLHTPLTSYYQQQQFHKAPRILDRIRAGEDVALVTDAGTPGISDPGAILVGMAVEAGIDVVPVPGPSAVVTLLSVSGLPTDRFVFEGFLPVKSGRKKRRVGELAVDPRTTILYESPHRLVKTLALLVEVCGDRRAAVGRELTKLHEEVRRGTLPELLEYFEGKKVLGEVTIAIAGFDG